MEHRALLAVALVAGCVTAAGAGGYLAVSQLAGPAATTPPAAVAAAEPEDAIQPVEGTESDVLPAADSATPVAEAPSPGPERPVRTEPAAAATDRPRPAAVATRSTPAATPSPAPAPPAVATRRDDPAPTWRPAPPPVSRPAEASTTAPAAPTTARNDDWDNPDSWPARDTSTPARDDRWPERDGDTTTATASVSSGTPTTDPGPAPAPVRRLESITIPSDSVIGVQLETTVSSQTARVEDPVRARVTRDVRSGGTVIVPAGSRLVGSVTLVEEGGKIRERARLGVRFHTLVLADGTELRLPTETIYRDGESPTGRSAAKIGGATAGGAILGAILGGGKGALIGAATGAGSGTAVAMAGERRPAELRSGQPITVRVTDNVTTQVER